MENLKFSKNNRKLNELAHDLGLRKSQVVGFDLPAGYTCPMADICKAQADRVTGKITDGAHSKFRCYAASIEARYTTTRMAHWNNFDLLNGLDESNIADLILKSIPKSVKVIRIHTSGDFFNRSYFNAWVKVAFMRPDISFFGYTKILTYVKANKPDNFKLVYSYGGIMDSKIDDTIPTCKVVSYSPTSACIASNSDDYYLIMKGESFTLNLHGTQKAKCKA